MIYSRRFVSGGTTADSVLIDPTLARVWIGRLCGVLAVAALFISGWGFRWQQEQRFEIPYLGWNGMAVGAVLLGAAVWLLRPSLDHFQVASPDTTQTDYKIGWPVTLAGVAMLAIFAGVNGHPLLRFLPISPHIQMALFIAGIGLVTWGMGGFQVRRGSWNIRLDWALLVVMLLGLGLRLWGLGETVHILIDELDSPRGVLNLRDLSNQRILDPLNYIAHFTYIFAYFQNPLMQLPGVDFFTGIRLVSVVFGTLTIPAVYGLGRALFDRRLALLAAAVLAFFPAHIHFSRLSMNNIADPLFGTLAFAGLVWGLRYHSQKAYVLGGVCLGLTSYFHESGRLLFLALAISWLGWVILTNRPRRHVRGLLLFTVSAILVASPYYYTAYMTENSGTPRFDSEGIRLYYLRKEISEEGLIEPLRRHWQEGQGRAVYHTIYSPDESKFYYGGNTAIIPWYVVPFYLMGLFYLLWRCRSGGALIWFWIVGGLVGIGLLVSPGWTARFVALFPAMAVGIAAGMRYPLEMIWPERGRKLLAFITLSLVVVTGAAQLWHYYGDHMTLYNRQVRMQMHDFASAQEVAAELAPNALLIYIADQMVYTPVLDYHIALRYPDMNYLVWRYDELNQAKLAELPLDRPLAFAFEPNAYYPDKIWEVMQEFPLAGPYYSRYPSIPVDRQYEVYLYIPAANE